MRDREIDPPAPIGMPDELRVLGDGGAYAPEIGDDSAAPAEVNQVLDDFATAYAEADADLMEAIITEDYFFTEDFYSAGEVTPDFTYAGPFTRLEVESSTYRIERFGEPIVTGEGPWFVTVGEVWVDPMNRSEGTANYVIVDDGGTPKVAKYYWAGVKVPVEPDFAE